MAMAHNPFKLLLARRFAPLFVTQFCGAFNDNVLKAALALLITFESQSVLGLAPSVMVQLAAGLFILPFFLFSATAGQIADTFDKARLIRLVKLAEIGIAALAAVGFVRHAPLLLLGALVLMGVHSTVFGPLKYSILPQHLAPDEVVAGNAWVESATFIAILLGSVVGGLLIAIHPGGEVYAGAACVLLAVCGFVASWWVPVAPPSGKMKANWNPVTEIVDNFRFAAGNRTVFLSMMGISWFWFFGALFLTQFPPLVKNVLGGTEHLSTFLQGSFIVGIALGSFAAERLSGGRIELGLVPLASIGLTLFGVDLYFAFPAHPAVGLDISHFLAQPGSYRLMADLLLLGAAGGLYNVPLYALVQTRCEASHRSRIVATNNILNAGFMVASAGFGAFALHQGLSIPALILIVALMNAAVALFIYRLVPEFLLRLIVWLLVHTVYRLRVKGLENIPETGPVLLTCNHVSFVDPLIVMAASPRPIRFVMDHAIFRLPIMRFVFREARAIPIAPAKEDAAMLARAYEEVAQALAAGEVVALFPEGRITDTGEMYPFKGGVAKIVARTPVPVIPMALSGLWGSFFSRKDGPAMSKPFRRGLLSRIGLAVGPAVPPEVLTPEALQAAIAGLREQP